MIRTGTGLSAWLAMLVLLGACGLFGDSGDETAGRSVDQILADSARAMGDISSAAFVIEQSGGDVFIDDADQLAFQSAEGRFASPASAEALVTVDALGFTTEVGAVAIDGTLWFSDPLTGTWSEAPESFTFDPATLFDPEEGWPALLTEAIGSAELVADDPAGDGAPGGPAHLRTTVSARRVSVLTGGLLTEETEVDLWIDEGTSRVVEARFDLPVAGGVSSWTMTIGDYDAAVDILPPDVRPDG